MKFNEEDFEIMAEWGFDFARRYKGIRNSRLSFDLLNEPPKRTDVTYEDYKGHTLDRRMLELLREF